MNATILKTKNADQQNIILKREGIRRCERSAQEYPALLEEISKPPEILYVRGNLPKEDDFTFAVVGTRKHTPYAARVIDAILPKLIRAGAIIVSGLALGIDALAHKAAIQEGAKTIAVLGGGIDKKTIYPQNNYSLAERILCFGGALVSEYPPLFAPTRYTFPERNRIIAGMSRGVLVIEAPRGSGALITAYGALEEGRDVFAVPGDITRMESVGCNELIRRGAKPVTSAEDILEEYGLTAKTKQKEGVMLDSLEQSIVSLLENATRHIDELVREIARPVADISGALTLLELKGVVKDIGGMRFVRTN